MAMDSLADLMTDELKDIYNAENQLLKALPKMAKKATSKELKAALTSHLKETEGHINEALRLSPLDTVAHIWMLWTGLAKSQLNAGVEAVAWMRRGLELNRNFSVAHFHLAAELALLGELDQARAAAQAGLALDPDFTILRFRAGTATDDPVYLAGRDRSYEGLRIAGIPQG